MSELEELHGCVRAISVQVTQSIRTEPRNPGLAGWGQFLETSSQVFQIGPYGTAAGVLVNQIAFPDAPIDERIHAQLRAFWGEKPSGKLYPQNVRLAFIVLALGRTTHEGLGILRDEIAAELCNRQLVDGSWSDSVGHPNGRPDSTAWAVLALNRASGFTSSVEKGAKWLANRAHGTGRIELLSSIGTAAAILGHPKPASVPALRARGFELLKKASVDREELICFFDYDELRNLSAVPARDYLCFPAFYPLAILVDGLANGAGFVEVVRLEAYRSDTIERLARLSDGHAYKTAGARYSSTVDQAAYALSYEHLSVALTHEDRVARLATNASVILVPLYKWSQGSILIYLVAPLLFVSISAVTLKEPTAVPITLKLIFGNHFNWLFDLTTTYKSEIQVFVAFLIALVPRIPQRGLKLLKKKLFRR